MDEYAARDMLRRSAALLRLDTFKPVMIDNPDRRWWQVWKPRRVLDPELRKTFAEQPETVRFRRPPPFPSDE